MTIFCIHWVKLNRLLKLVSLFLCGYQKILHCMCGSYYIFSDTELDGKTHLGSSILKPASIGFTVTIYYFSIESNHNPIPFLLLSHVIISQLFPKNICFEAELQWAEHRDRDSREQLPQYRKEVWVLQAPKLTMRKGRSNSEQEEVERRDLWRTMWASQ